MLDYAWRLTVAPSAVRRDDVEALRAHGFDDRAILEVCRVTAAMNHLNRLADGLGVERPRPPVR